MTPSTSDATHVRWTDLPQDRPMEMIARRRIVGEKVMLSEIELSQGCVVPTHAHENEQMAWVVRGKLKFGIGAEGSPERHDVVVESGGVLVVPSNVPHSAEALEDSLVLGVFSPISETTGVDRGH